MAKTRPGAYEIRSVNIALAVKRAVDRAPDDTRNGQAGAQRG